MYNLIYYTFVLAEISRVEAVTLAHSSGSITSTVSRTCHVVAHCICIMFAFEEQEIHIIITSIIHLET